MGELTLLKIIKNINFERIGVFFLPYGNEALFLSPKHGLKYA